MSKIVMSVTLKLKISILSYAWRPSWIYANKAVFHTLDSIRLFICYLGVISETRGGGINSVAICGGSFCICTGLM